jgi:hypothetical protein
MEDSCHLCRIRAALSLWLMRLVSGHTRSVSLQLSAFSGQVFEKKLVVLTQQFKR